MSADEYKAQGNAAFAAKDFNKAVELFSKAIDVAEQPNHVLYSNRSGAYASLKQYNEALSDARVCLNINPTWAKGYTREAAAHHGLGDLLAAHQSYEKALQIDPSNAQAKSGLKSVEEAMTREGGPSGGEDGSGIPGFNMGPQELQRLAQNPKTSAWVQEPGFIEGLQKVMADPMKMLQNMGSIDPRYMQAMQVAMGIPDVEGGQAPSAESTSASNAAESKPTTSSANKEQPKEEPKDESQVEADKAKAEGNTAYKKRQFDEAIEHYNKAWDLHQDITYLNNRAAAEFEKGDYETAIQTCKLAISEGQERRADYKLIAKAYARIGTSYLKQENLAAAIDNFEKSLTEHRSPDVLTKLRNTQRELRKREEDAYQDPVKAEEARNEGNELFKKGEFPQSVKAYSEAIKRDPKDPRGYGNRAAAYLKLMSYPEVINDCDKAIELDPKFFKAYTRKATALNVMKQYRKSMDTLEEARTIDTDMKHSREIDELYNKALTSRFAPLDGETEEKRAERLSQDPEIDQIRRDPIMNQILQQAATNPAALRDHLSNPEIARKINLLAAAGIIRTR